MTRRLFLLAALSTPAIAQQVLYEPLPPAGSAYLRVVNATQAPLTVRPNLVGAVTLDIEPARRVTAYTVQENVAGRALDIVFSAGPAQGAITLRLEPGSFNTLVVVQEGAQVRGLPVIDQTQFNQTRARLTFYNATSSCAGAGLVLDPEGQSVFSDLGPGLARMRSVNPVSARVRIVCGTERGQPFPLGAMEAGGQYSIWFMEGRGQPIGFITRDATAPWRR